MSSCTAPPAAQRYVTRGQRRKGGRRPSATSTGVDAPAASKSAAHAADARQAGRAARAASGAGRDLLQLLLELLVLILVDLALPVSLFNLVARRLPIPAAPQFFQLGLSSIARPLEPPLSSVSERVVARSVTDRAGQRRSIKCNAAVPRAEERASRSNSWQTAREEAREARSRAGAYPSPKHPLSHAPAGRRLAAGA